MRNDSLAALCAAVLLSPGASGASGASHASGASGAEENAAFDAQNTALPPMIAQTAAVQPTAGQSRPPRVAAPVVLASSALSAWPASQSIGAAGPVNRFAVDLARLHPDDASWSVECVYRDALRYRCQHEFPPATAAGDRRRVRVSVPDLDRGSEVILRFVNAGGASELKVQIANPPQVIHEIEALPLPDGGKEETSPEGKRVPDLKLRSLRTTTTPALALSMPTDRLSCDSLYAQWSSVSATDAVFASRFGTLDGTILLARAVEPATPVSMENLPLWLVTYPAAATRVQFIAHYQVFYRVGICPDRIIR